MLLIINSEPGYGVSPAEESDRAALKPQAETDSKLSRVTSVNGSERAEKTGFCFTVN